MEYSPPVSSASGICQTRILEWVECPPQGIFPIQGSNPFLRCLLHPQVVSLPLVPPGKPQRESQCVCGLLSHVQLLSVPWTAALQAPLSVGIFQQKYWSGLPCPPPRDLPSVGSKPGSPAMQADSLPSKPPGKPKNTGAVVIPSPGEFLTQEVNHGPLHCRQILYQLSYQGSTI